MVNLSSVRDQVLVFIQKRCVYIEQKRRVLCVKLYELTPGSLDNLSEMAADLVESILICHIPVTLQDL